MENDLRSSTGFVFSTVRTGAKQTQTPSIGEPSPALGVIGTITLQKQDRTQKECMHLKVCNSERACQN